MSRIGMIVYSDYPGDPRVRREAEALVAAGHRVDVVCLRLPDQSPTDTVRGVGVSRINLQHKRGGKLRYLWNYAYFFMRALGRITRLWVRHRYQIVHIHNMPEFLVFAAIIPRCFGARTVVDLHDPMPEVFMAKFEKGYDHHLIRLLRFLERISLRFASAVITTNTAFLELFVGRGCPREKIRIVMNAPQESVFERTPAASRAMPEEDLTLMYHGTVVQRYGLDTAIRAMPTVLQKIPGARLRVYNQGEFLEAAKALVDELGLHDIVSFHGRFSLEDISDTIDAVDIGLVPNHRNAFTELNFPTRIFEFLARKRPVIAPRTRGVQDYFDEDSLFYFDPDDPDDLAAVILKVASDPTATMDVVSRGYAIYEQHRWAGEARGLLELVDGLTV